MILLKHKQLQTPPAACHLQKKSLAFKAPSSSDIISTFTAPSLVYRPHCTCAYLRSMLAIHCSTWNSLSLDTYMAFSSLSVRMSLFSEAFSNLYERATSHPTGSYPLYFIIPYYLEHFSPSDICLCLVCPLPIECKFHEGGLCSL